jgi:hypothetical protein
LISQKYQLICIDRNTLERALEGKKMQEERSKVVSSLVVQLIISATEHPGHLTCPGNEV